MFGSPKMESPKPQQVKSSENEEPVGGWDIANLEYMKENGSEVLQNLDITEKNAEFLNKMAQIEEELKKRKQVLGFDPDTGEPKLGKNSEFDVLKQKTIEETRNNLTKSSKYVKGAVIAGVVAAFFNYAPGLREGFTSSDVIQHLVEDPSRIKDLYEHIADHPRFNNILLGVSIPAFVASSAVAIKSGIRAISQEIKTRVASNQKVQRMVAMMTTGMTQKDAHNVVFVETAASLGPNSNSMNNLDKAKFVPDSGVPFTGASRLDVNDPYYLSIQGKEDSLVSVSDIRTKLEEMGIKRISREKYKDPKSQLNH